MSVLVASDHAVATGRATARCARRASPAAESPARATSSRSASTPCAATDSPCPYTGLYVATESPIATNPSGQPFTFS